MKSISIFKPALGAILILGCTILILGCSQDPPPAISPDDIPLDQDIKETPSTNSPDTSDQPAK